MLDFERFSHLTFDCYGTLIDWETGILAALRPILGRHGVAASDERVLTLYAAEEAVREAGAYRPYRDVLRGVVEGLGAAFGFVPDEADLTALPDSVGAWPPFADTVAALARLKSRYKLVILSNIDDGLFAATNRLLQVEFDAIITAQQLRSYKPAHAHFHAAPDRLDVPRERILHVAQSLYHDHAPAKALGFSTVWVNRPSLLPGTGLALQAVASPDLEVPDLASLADLMGL